MDEGLKKKDEKYKWSKLILVIMGFSIILWLISGIDETRVPIPDPGSLIVYEGKIKQFIDIPGKYGTAYYIDIETDKTIKRLWFISPITCFWHVLKENYPNATLTVYGRPYGEKRVHVWELHVGSRVLFTYNDRIKMGKEETNRFEKICINTVIICLFLLVLIFPFERRQLIRKMAQQFHSADGENVGGAKRGN